VLRSGMKSRVGVHEWEALIHSTTTATTTTQYALYGFLPLMAYAGSFSPEQTLSFYLGCGVFSALGSHLMSALVTRNVIPSLGASGALWGVMACSALFMPDAGVSIIFLPWIKGTMSQFLPFLVLVDVMGVLLRWRYFDHAAHLSGAVGGYLYYAYGQDAWKHMVHYFYHREKEARAAASATSASPTRAGSWP
jgi:rhomboid-like protein